MTDVLNEDLKPTTQTSNFRLMAVFFIGAPILLFAGMWAANHVFETGDAILYKTTLAAMLGGGGLFSLAGTVTQGVKRTDGKIALQVAKAALPAKYAPYADAIGGIFGKSNALQSPAPDVLDFNDAPGGGEQGGDDAEQF